MSKLKDNIRRALESYDFNQSIPLDDVISTDPQQFYDKLGYLRNPSTRQPVTELADYQVETWKALLEYKRILAIKSHKIGLSTSFLMADLQLALLPTSHPLSSKGFDTLILAQTKAHALEHIRTLRKMVIESPTYSKYLINRPIGAEDDGDNLIQNIIRDDKTKQSVLFIRNNENERRPSRIIGIGIDNPGALESWKEIHHIHISDPTAAIGDISDSINVALSRLANTNGSCVIETIPGEIPAGKIFDMYQLAKADPENYQFKLFEIEADRAVKAGIILQQFLDAQKQELGDRYPAYYEAKFANFSGSIFSADSINKAVEVQYNPDLINPNTNKVLAVDAGFGSSKTGIVIVEHSGDKIYVLYAKDFERPDYNEIMDIIRKLIARYDPLKIKVDAANPEVIRSIKDIVGEDPNYEQITDDWFKRAMRVQPVSFSREGREILANLKHLMDTHKVAIDRRFAELIRQLRIANTTPDGNLDKTTFSLDQLDCLRMACSGFHIRRMN